MRYQVRMHPTLDILVSSVGEVFVPANGTHKAHWTFGSNNGRGYLCVNINGKSYKVHRLVAGTFIPNPLNKPQIDHISRNPQDNRVENLRWATTTDNNRNRRDNDRVEARGGTHCYENMGQYKREYYLTNKQSYRERDARRSKTHKKVLFSDGKERYVPNSEASEIRKLPVKERIFKGD